LTVRTSRTRRRTKGKREKKGTFFCTRFELSLSQRALSACRVIQARAGEGGTKETCAGEEGAASRAGGCRTAGQAAHGISWRVAQQEGRGGAEAADVVPPHWHWIVAARVVPRANGRRGPQRQSVHRGPCRSPTPVVRTEEVRHTAPWSACKLRRKTRVDCKSEPECPASRPIRLAVPKRVGRLQASQRRRSD
jgi:hypothetical protein